jgi:hypothetical protein
MAPYTTAELIFSCKIQKVKAGNSIFRFLLLSLLIFLIVVSQSYGSAVEFISSDANGVLLELKVGELNVGSREFNGRQYHLISYEGSGFTTEAGKPRMPISRAYVGIPPSGSVSVTVIDYQFSSIPDYNPIPVFEKNRRTSAAGLDVLVEEFSVDREFYQTNSFYPPENAVLTYEGYIRRQRVAVIELHPVQYNPVSKILRKYSRLLVRVNFSKSFNAPSKIQPRKLELRDETEFERLYRGLLLNYDQAKNLRKTRSKISLAPRQNESEALKLFVSQTGIYRLDYAMLQGAGVDLSQLDPRTIKIKLRGEEVPIYIKGEADGRFDHDDYLEFFGAKPESIYTNWNVYWLTWSGSRGIRVVQKEGNPNARTAKAVTFFKSIERFEEDHIHHKLQHVHSDADNPDEWFESRDHWFWDGIENGSSKNEMTVDFPIYDLAQTMVRPDFKIELVGGTNFEHNIMISVNGHKVGKEALWDSQEIYSFDGRIAANSIKDGINKLRLIRIGSNPGDGENTLTYPHHVYLNWFEVGYLRELIAVDDILKFSAPEPDDPNTDEINRYEIRGFLSGDVEIFQIENSNAICRIEGAEIKKYILNQDDRDRLKFINSIQNEETSPFDTPKIPDSAYSATFEDKAIHSPQYIAVTSASVLKPDRIEMDARSNLRETSNQADYIIISHPMFMDVAQQLADWRGDVRGGGFTTKVVDVTDIYDEFNYGMLSPHAIKGFLKYAYNNWLEPAPSYALIMGDATYDFLGINKDVYQEPPELIGFIPAFYIWTTFGQTATDHWYSTIDGDDGFPDVHLGRIAVEEVSQAENVLEKIINNESGQFNGEWRKQIISVADDDTHAAGDEIFQIGLEEIWREYTPLGYDTEKIYLKEIIKQVEQNPLETRRPGEVAEEMIVDAFGRGAVLAQYSGHGGRHVWAHEIVLSITDIEDMMEIHFYPFLLVMSCYNGYFDLPGELSMAEGMLRARRKGVVATLNATRLTYGTGNVALNRALFDSIFKYGMLRVGESTTSAKIRVLMDEGSSQLSQLQEYTLFGDPASRLNLPDYEIYPEFKSASVAPGGKLEIISGQVLNSINGQPGNFSGEMEINISFPDGRTSSKTVNLTNGIYPAIPLDVPSDMRNGRGLVKFFGTNTVEAVLGGIEFSVNEPSIFNISHELSQDQLLFYAAVNDNAGISGIRSVSLNWRYGSPDYTIAPMVFDRQNNIYRLDDPIPVTNQGGQIYYFIKAEDADGNSVVTETGSVKIPGRPNLTISKLTNNPEASILYNYSQQSKSWGINVDLSSGLNKPSCSVQIVAFGKNPDVDKNRIVDDNVEPLGKTEVSSDIWDDEGKTSVFVPLTLPTGKNAVFVWLDPEYSSNNPDNILGECDETNENDNISSIVLDVTHVLVNPFKATSARSLDYVFDLSIPAGAVGAEKPIAIKQIYDVQEPAIQPDISFIPIPGMTRAGYDIIPMGDVQNQGSENQKFQKPVSVRMKFGLESFKEKIKSEIGLPGIPDEQMNDDQMKLLEQVLKERLSQGGIYQWAESARRWVYMPSYPVEDNDGNVMSLVQSTVPIKSDASDDDDKDNSLSDREFLTPISIDDGSNTPIDDWSIIFIDSQQFRVEGIKTGVLSKNNETYIGNLGEEFYHQSTGFRFTIIPELDNFAAGDEFRFETLEVGVIEATAESSGIFSLMQNKDSQPPDINIEIGDQNFADGDIVSHEPNIQALISDDNGVDILTRQLSVSMSRDGGEFQTVGEDEYNFHWDGISNTVIVNYLTEKLDPGEYEVRIQAYDFNGNMGAKTVKFLVKREFELEKDSLMNYPNPFERETDITFQLSSLADEAIVKIYTVSGRLIRTLRHNYAVNFVIIHWDGRDEDGDEVANGVYYYKIRLKQEGRKDITEIGKMMKLK